MKEAFLLGAYLNTFEKEKAFSKTVADLRKIGFPIIVSTHYPISKEFQESVDYVIFDKNNPMSESIVLTQYYIISGGVTVTAPWEEPYHAPAALTAIQNAVDFCRGRFDRVYFQEYDVSFINYDLYVQKVREYNKPLTFFRWFDDPAAISTSVFAFKTDYFQNWWKFPVHSCEDYLKNLHYANHPNFIMESLATRLLQGLDYYIFTEDEKNAILYSYNLCEADSKHKSTKVWVCYANNNKAMLFIINYTTRPVSISIDSKYCNLKYTAFPATPDPIITDGRLNFVDCRWWLLEREGTLKVTYGEEIKSYNLDQAEPINEASFSFNDKRVVQEV